MCELLKVLELNSSILLHFQETIVFSRGVNLLNFDDEDDGISCSVSGPAFWGLINPEWSLCNNGRRQSPIDLEPAKLLYDPNLRPVSIDKDRVSFNGHSPVTK